LLILVMKALSH